MAKKYRLGVAAMVHDHVWGELRHWAKQDDVEIVAAGDVNADLREKIQAQYNVPRVYESWQAMIENEDLDIVQAASENSVCADIVEACAAKGIHVISEKPMAATSTASAHCSATATSSSSATWKSSITAATTSRSTILVKRFPRTVESAPA